MWAQTKRGFTIVELLIVVVVIAILAAITVVSFTGISEQARMSQAESDLRNLTQAIHAARINTNKTLPQITGSNDSRGSKALADAAIDDISAASGMDLSGLKSGDPWGNWYRIDENELEQAPTDCRQDSIDVTGHAELRVLIPFSSPVCL